MGIPHSIATTTMKLLASISALLPQLHAFLDEDSFYQLGATWTAADGLREQHNLELRYTHNSERLALQGATSHQTVACTRSQLIGPEILWKQPIVTPR